MSGPQDWVEGRERLRGWRDVLAESGLAVPDHIPADWTAERGYQAGRLMVAGELPGAVFAANDQLALGLLHAFTEAGVRVPQDVSLVGFDDIAGSDHFSPPLTTVRQEFATLGRACLRVLSRAIDGDPVAAEIIEPHLVVRASTAPPREPTPGGSRLADAAR